LPRLGFTLVEVMAVVALMAILAGGVAWAMTGEIRRASREDVVVKLAHADALTRLAARRLGRSRVLAFDLDRGTLTHGRHADRTAGSGGGDEAPPPRTVTLAPGHRLEQIALTRAGRVRRFDAGVVELTVSAAGHSATYALRLAPSGRGRERPDRAPEPGPWLVVAGLTGQVTQGYEDREIDNLFDTLTRPGLDAD